MLSLQLAIVVLTNAAWQDGEQTSPFSMPTQSLIRVSLLLLPVLSALCIWAMCLKVNQYGWTVDRVWAVVLVTLFSLYAAGYCLSALRNDWQPLLGTFNTWIALATIATLLALHTPLLNPQRVSAASQVSRLLAGKVDPQGFDYDYLRFQMGRAGNDALARLASLNGHPHSETIRFKAKQA